MWQTSSLFYFKILLKSHPSFQPRLSLSVSNHDIKARPPPAKQLLGIEGLKGHLN
jgi:hypothetical protein